MAKSVYSPKSKISRAHDQLELMSGQKSSRFGNKNREALIIHGAFRNQETNNEFNFPCPYYLGPEHLAAKNLLNEFIHSKFHTFDNGVEDLLGNFLISKGIKNGVLSCVCSRCSYVLKLYFYQPQGNNLPTGWYLTDLCAQRHSECGCSIQLQPRDPQSFVHAEPSLSTPVVGLKRSAESSESLILEPIKQGRTTALGPSAAFDENDFVLNNLDELDDLDELNMIDIPSMDGEEDDYGFQFLLCSRIMTSANLVDCTQLPDWLVLEVYEHLQSTQFLSPGMLPDPPTDLTAAQAHLTGCRSDVLLQAIVTVLAQAIQRYKDYHGAAFNFQATVLQARYNYLLNAVEFQNNILGAVKLVAREADALDALQAQTTQARVLSVLSTIYNTEVHGDCAHGYFQLALSWERSGNFEMKTKFLSRALFIFLQLCISSNSAGNSTSNSSCMVATTSKQSLKYSMLEPMYYLACLRFRTWCRDDFLRQKKMLEWCRFSVDVALQENDHNIDRWTKLCLLKAKILQSLAITHGELVEPDRQNFVHKRDILSEAVNLRLQLYDNNESHIEVARTQMHVVINQYELDQNMDNKRVVVEAYLQADGKVLWHDGAH